MIIGCACFDHSVIKCIITIMIVPPAGVFIYTPTNYIRFWSTGGLGELESELE